MTTSLLDRSLDDIAQDSSSNDGARRGGRGRGRGRARGAGIRTTSFGSPGGSSTGNGRAAPYTKPRAHADVDAAWQHDLYSTNKLNYGGEDDEQDGAAGRPSASAARKRGAVLKEDQEARSTRLKITNLHYEVSERELETLFVQIGPLAAATARESNPAIKFDASGRSMGEATVTYESEADAVRAREAFHNALAKGERIHIEYDFTPQRGPAKPRNNAFSADTDYRGGASASSLLARLDRGAGPTNRGQSNKEGYTSSIGRAADTPSRRGRNDNGPGDRQYSNRGGGDGPTARGGRGGNAAGQQRGGGRGGRREGNARPTKTVEDLDKELEDFMNGGSTTQTDADMA